MARILLAEDQDFMRDVLKQHLEKAGHEVLEARDGQECVTIYRRKKTGIDLVITDIVMPSKEGIHVVIEIGLINPNVKIIVISGGGGRFSPDLPLNAVADMTGVMATLAKPFSAERLLELVDQAITGQSS